MNNLKKTFRQLRWKLTLSYTAVTVGALLVVALVLGTYVFSSILIPNNVLTPDLWIQFTNEQLVPPIRSILGHPPVNTELITLLLREINSTITDRDFFRLGDTDFFIRSTAQIDILIIAPDGSLLGFSTPVHFAGLHTGRPLNINRVPGLTAPLQSALDGVQDVDRLFVTLKQNEELVFAVPVLSNEMDSESVLGAIAVYIKSLPTEDDINYNTAILVLRSFFVFLLGAGIMGTVFGSLTARGMVRRFKRLSATSDAWSQGDFTEFIDDPTGDEISQLAQRLNRMAEQLQNLLRRRQEMAVSEERNRLARDLHDSAKQQALAASFQLGTALTLFDHDPQAAKNHLQEADTLVDSVRQELTDLIHELRPPMMEGRDFAEILNEYAIEWAHQNEIDVNVNVQAQEEIPLELKQSLYRIMQEALANVARHSSANNTDVILICNRESITLKIKDDGEGFDPNERHSGMGLHSMRERTEVLDGKFTLDSDQGQGTEIVVSIPYRRGDSHV